MVTTTNTSWGGLDAGLYEILVTDNLGCTLVDTIEIGYLNINNFSTESIKIYPSLIVNKLLIIENGFEGNRDINLIDMTGRIVKTMVISQGKNEIQLDVSHGMYTVQLMSMDKTKIEMTTKIFVR